MYTKRHLGAGEAPTFVRGQRDPLVRIDDWTAGIAVCADANRPSHPARAAARGVSAYLVCTFITPADLADRVARIRDYAVQHGLTVAFANHGGPTGGEPAGGSSTIWSPTGEVLARHEGLGAGVIVG